MVTPRQIIEVICNESDLGTPKMGLYQPELRRARRLKKGGVTELTFVVRTVDFSPNDVIMGTADNNLVAFLLLSTVGALKAGGLD